MLQNAYFLAKIGADTAENEQHFAEILPTDALWRLRLGGGGQRRHGVGRGAEHGAHGSSTARAWAKMAAKVRKNVDLKTAD